MIKLSVLFYSIYLDNFLFGIKLGHLKQSSGNHKTAIILKDFLLIA